MPELVRERADAAEAGLVVGEYARFVAAQAHAERAVALAGARLGVDPLPVERAAGEIRQARRVEPNCST